MIPLLKDLLNSNNSLDFIDLSNQSLFDFDACAV